MAGTAEIYVVGVIVIQDRIIIVGIDRGRDGIAVFVFVDIVAMRIVVAGTLPLEGSAYPF